MVPLELRQRMGIRTLLGQGAHGLLGILEDEREVRERPRELRSKQSPVEDVKPAAQELEL